MRIVQEGVPIPAPARPTASSILWTGSTPSVTHIPDRGRHCVRYYGALANHAQSPKAFSEQQTPPAPDPGASGETTSEFVQRRRASWARLIKRIFEVDPLLCSCGAEEFRGQATQYL